MGPASMTLSVVLREVWVWGRALFSALLPPQVTITANSRVIKVPYQMLINGRFVDSAEGKTYETINPTTEEV